MVFKARDIYLIMEAIQVVQITKEELKQLIKDAVKEALEELIPEVKLSESELKELQEIEKQYYEGKFVKWKDIRMSLLR